MTQKPLITDHEFKHIAKYYNKEFNMWKDDELYDKKTIEDKYKHKYGLDFYKTNVKYTHKGLGIFKKINRRKKINEILTKNEFELKSKYSFSKNNLKEYYFSKKMDSCLILEYTEELPRRFGGFEGMVYLNQLHMLFYTPEKQSKTIEDVLTKIEKTPNLIEWKFVDSNNY